MFKRIAVLLLLPVLALALPTPQGYVTDVANVLGDAGNGINHHLFVLEKKTSIEIAVVTVPSLDGYSVEEYANQLFHTWGIGKKGKNNGVLLLASMKEHKIRIEVGYGLEPQLTDAFCGDVIRDQMTPNFKAGRFAEGFKQAIMKIEDRLQVKI